MNITDFVKENIVNLQEKDITNITKNKIDYISDYVNNWTYVNENSRYCNNLNFIDCMCNAGIYNDGTLTTSMRILEIFINHAKIHKEKRYNIFLNDINKMRVQTIKKLSLLLNKEKIKNVNLYFDSVDVNEYLTSMARYNDVLKNNSCSILFVDPYNFGNVKIELLKEFSNNYYSELIFNYFLSDFRRNINNQAAPKKIEKIKHSMEGIQGFNDEMSYEELLKLIQAEFKKSKICYSFAYQFYTKTNVPFYSIIYATPHHVGLEKIKESIWKIFEGQGYYRNNDKSESSEQLALFDQKELNEKYYCDEAKNMILKVYRGKEVSYDEICVYLLENSLLKKGQIINGVLKPLVENKFIEKMNKNGNRNFSKDNFKIKDN